MSTASVRFQRAQVIVRDLEQALGFYRDILGLEVASLGEAPGDSHAYALFEIDPKARLRFATLSAPGQPAVVGLTEIKGVTLKHCPDPKRSAMVLEVADFDYVCERSIAWGLIVHPEQQSVGHDGRSSREAGIVDHDGNLVVVSTLVPKSG